MSHAMTIDEFSKHENETIEKEIRGKRPIGSYFLSLNFLGIIIFLYIILTQGTNVGKIFFWANEFSALALSFLNIPGSEAIAGFISIGLFITLLWTIFSKEHNPEWIEKIWMVVLLVSVLFGIYSSYSQDIGTNDLGDVSSEVISQSGENVLSFWEEIYCSAYGKLKGVEKCIEKEATTQVEATNNQYFSIKLEPNPINSINIKPQETNQRQFFIKYTTENVPIELLSYSCYFENEKEPFFTNSELKKTNVKISTKRDYTCEGIEKILLGTGQISKTSKIIVKLNYSVSSEISQPIPILHCNNNQISTYLEKNGYSCSDITLEHFKNEISSEFDTSLTPKGGTAIDSEVVNLKHLLPLQAGDGESKKVNFQVNFKKSTNGKVGSISDIKLTLPQSLKQSEGNNIELKKKNEFLNDDLYVDFSLEENEGAQLNDKEMISEEDLKIEYTIQLEKTMSTQSILFKRDKDSFEVDSNGNEISNV